MSKRSCAAPSSETRFVGYRAAIRGALVLTALVLTALVLAATGRADSPVRRSFHGVVVQSPLDSEDISRMRHGRVGTVRLLIPWNIVERTEGRYDFSKLDREFAAIASAGARPQPFVFGSPRWLRAEPSIPPPLTTPGAGGWRAFLIAVTARYGRDGTFWRGRGETAAVKRWQIWNEANLDGLWAPQADPHAYGRLLRISERAIHAVDRRAEIVLSGLAPTGAGIYPGEFLRQLYRSPRVVRAFDSVALHPYGTTVGDVRRQVQGLRKVMRRGGTPKRPLLVTEIGWGSDGPRGRSLAGSDKMQARLLTRTYSLLARNRFRWRIPSVAWFAWRDTNGAAICHFCFSSGLFENGGRAKPAWKAWKRSAREWRAKP